MRSVNEQEAWQNLASAIVRQACEDYVRVLNKLEKAHDRRRRRELEDERDRLQRFFRSQWCTELTGADGDTIIRALDKNKKIWRNI